MNLEHNPLVPARLPSYLADAFGDLFEEDGLLVLGRGLGLLSLLAAFIRFYADAEEGYSTMMAEENVAQSPPTPSQGNAGQPRRPPLVFVLGLREGERQSLLSTLTAWGTSPDMLPIEVTNESGQGKDRSLLYKRGGVFLITSRIFIVDLLTGVAAPRDIEGILVTHAENVTEQSTEAFILRIYRTQKQWVTHQAVPSVTPPISSTGFVKAFSDNPDSLMAGFAKVDKILKALHVRRLYLYPRFHECVASELEKTPPRVTELHQQLTPKMKEIQNAIAAAVQTCIRELKKSTSLIQWTESDLTLENCVTTNFELSISRQLEHDWHRLKPQTKQMVNDLRTLRTLFQYLVQYDCVAFWRLINSIRTMSAAARNPSLWLLTPAADLLFRRAKDRLYRIEKPRPTRDIPDPVARLKPVLEENPKWRLLREVLTEVRKEWNEGRKHTQGERGDNIEDSNVAYTNGGSQVLIVVKDEKTLDAIKTYLVEGRERTMTLRWLRYLEHHNDRSRAVAKSAAAANSRGNGGSSVSTGNSAALSEEGRLLLEEEGRTRNFLFGPKTPQKGKNKRPVKEGDAIKQGEKRVIGAMPEWKRKRRRIAKEMGRGERTLQSEDLERRAVLDEALEETEHSMAFADSAERGRSSESVDVAERELSEDCCTSSEDEDELPYKVHSFDDNDNLRVVIRTHASVEGDQALSVLNDLKPRFVVLYDAEPSFIRSLEVYAATILASTSTSGEEAGSRPNQDRLRVFFMLFEASSEEKNYLKGIEREQNAFERLIQHKKSMPLPVITMGGTTQEMQAAMGGAGGSYAGGTLPLSVDTRTGRGKQTTDTERRDIAVDVREFRSSLPSILHQGGMRLAPVTLTVGDFVLSNVHCIERKSISDLFGSFASGRLYTQSEAMSKHYKCPCLLIEFDPAKSFSLQNSNELGADIKTDSVCSKMTLLTIHFPRLRILWSRSPHETLKVFKALKTNHEEVDVDRAVELGSNESLDSLLVGSNVDEDDDGEIDEVNDAARDMLLRLPGVNVHNARKIMNVCDSIAELADMPREKLKELLGPITGQKLFTFFRQKLMTM